MRTAAAIAALMLIAPAAGAQEAGTRTETRVMVLNGSAAKAGWTATATAMSHAKSSSCP